MISEQMYVLGSGRSCIRELFEYGLKRAAAVGAENVYDYSMGNPSVPAPRAVNEAISGLVLGENTLPVHGYTVAPGAAAARQAIADDLNARFGAAVRPENLYLTCGAAPALLAVIKALAVEGAEFLAIAPFFPEYQVFVSHGGGKLTAAYADPATFQIDPAALEAALTPHTQAVIVNSPNNPTGAVYTRETLEAAAAVLRRKAAEYGHPIYIISDEPYRELVYDGAEVPFIPSVYPDTIICYSYSKSLSLPGERIGYVCVPDCAADSDKVYAAVTGAARASGHVCAPSLMQLAVAACADLRPDIAAYDRNRRTLYEALTEYGYECVMPKGAFYMFIKAPGGDAKAFSDLAKKHDLLLVPGGDFGSPDHFRISTCVSHDMILRSLPAFRKVLAEARGAK